jgi:glycosyltransferase involved in cell wall biosynthesis
MNITVLINTYNEEENMKACIESAKLLTDTIIVIDMHSSDKTVLIAKEMGAEVHYYEHMLYVEPARNFGMSKVSTEWAFILDADERMTPDLAQEVKGEIQNPSGTHYKIPRKELFAEKVWLKHGGWWPNHQIRLIQKSSFTNWPREIHSYPTIHGPLGYLKEPLLHYSKNNYDDIVAKTIIFEDIESDLLYKADRNVSLITFFRKFAGELYRRLLKGLAFLDGNVGIIEAVYQAFSKTITYLYLYEKKKSRPL